MRRGKEKFLYVRSRPQVIVYYLFRDNLRFQSSFLRWITLYVPDRFAATLYMLKVRGSARGVIKIGNEKKLTTAASR